MTHHSDQGAALPGSPLTIAMVAACPFPQPRGTPIRIQRMAEGLAARGHRVHIVTYHHGTGDIDPSLAMHRIRDIPTYHMLGPGPSYQKLLVLDPFLAVKLARVIRYLQVDVIHAHHYEGLMVAAAARLRTRIPLVYDAHTLLASELRFYRLGLPIPVKRFVGERLDRWIPRWSDHVISVAETIRNKLVKAGTVSPERITVVPNGVEIRLFDADPRTASDKQNGSRLLIFTGNLATYQGIDLLLRAFRKVLDRRQNVRLMIVSESSFERYEAMAQDLGIRESIDVVTAGFDRVPSLLAGADLAVNPRIDCDGVPLKLLNYMAASKPVVSFAGSAPGIKHGETGWLVQDGDVAAFADGALTLLAEATLAERIGRNARRYVEAHHSWERAAEQIEKVYRHLLGARGTRTGVGRD